MVGFGQSNTTTIKEINKLADEFTPLWLSPPPIDLAMPRSLHIPRKEDLRYIYVFNYIMLLMVEIFVL